MPKRHVLQKKPLLSLLKGYKRANKLMIEEKQKRLEQLTPEESLREYLSLCETAEKSINTEEREILQQRKIAFLLRRRQALDKTKR